MSAWRGIATEIARTVLVAVWKVRCRFGPSTTYSSTSRVGVVLLSYNRAANMDPILRAVLKCQFVDRVLLSNNNSRKRVDDFISVSDRRFASIDQTSDQRPGNRWSIARDQLSDCEIILALDDDVFLYPRQIRQLVARVQAEPQSVHGFAGMTGRSYRSESDEIVDHVVRAYATTQDNIKRYFELIGRMGEAAADVERIGDDIVISLAAPGPPRIHAVGLVLSCASSTQDGVAVNREDDFTSVRDLIFSEATRVRSG